MMRRGVLLFFLTALASGSSLAYEPFMTIEAHAGSLPLLLTVPHDGAATLGMIPARRNGTTVRDVNTRLLAERIASALEKATGKRPYIVIANFSRKYLDANRPESEAMESADALPAYRAYHDRVAAYVAELNEKFPQGALLVDVHGQGVESNTVFRGTQAGLTTKRLVGRFGSAAIQGDVSITGILAAKGYKVHPAPGAASLREDPRFAGGYTVVTYGSHKPGGIDAIQLESGLDLRNSERFAQDLAEALVKFMKGHEILPK